MNVADSNIKALLQKYKKICVIGLSPDKAKPSHQIPMFMKKQGYEIVGVYPDTDSSHGIKIYSSLSEVPAEFRKFINVFRASDRIPEVVEDILNVGNAEVVWLQLGIKHAFAEAKAEAAGLSVVSDRCLLIEYRNHFQVKD